MRSLNSPLTSRRRYPLAVSETTYVVDRFGQHSLQAMSVMTGVSQSSIRDTVSLIDRAAAPEPSKAERPCKLKDLPIAAPLRTATLSLGEAAHELGLTTKALHEWLIRKRWIWRGRRGALIAGAAKLTAGLLNQPVNQIDDGHRVRVHYGSIRFTPRGMANLRAQLLSTGN